MKKRFFLLFLSLITSGIFATSGGGIFSGEYFYDSDFANIDLSGVTTSGGYGYGSSRDGVRSGGFGFIITREDDNFRWEDNRLNAGAFGGFITGRETFVGPLLLATNLWLGLGVTDFYGTCGFGEINGEVGYPIFSWLQIQAYGGLQGFSPIDEFLDIGIYSPTLGIRIVFGSFRRR